MDERKDRLHNPIKVGRLKVRFSYQGFDGDWTTLPGVSGGGNTLWPLVVQLEQWHARLVAEVARLPQNIGPDFPLQGIFLEAYTDG